MRETCPAGRFSGWRGRRVFKPSCYRVVVPVSDRTYLLHFANPAPGSPPSRATGRPWERGMAAKCPVTSRTPRRRSAR